MILYLALVALAGISMPIGIVWWRALLAEPRGPNPPRWSLPHPSSMPRLVRIILFLIPVPLVYAAAVWPGVGDGPLVGFTLGGFWAFVWYVIRLSRTGRLQKRHVEDLRAVHRALTHLAAAGYKLAWDPESRNRSQGQSTLPKRKKARTLGPVPVEPHEQMGNSDERAEGKFVKAR